MTNKFDNKVVVVTGGTSGIGLATARAFAAEGASVFITGRRQDALDAAVTQIGGLRYAGADYGHQGWLTEDHKYFVFGDEGDEIGSGIKTTTYIIDVSNLANPVVSHTFANSTASTDHNLYVKGNYAFMAGYTAGMRILDLTNIGAVSEKGFLDTYPPHDNSGYQAVWGVYPFFGSGIVVTSGSEGLFILRPQPGLLQ